MGSVRKRLGRLEARSSEARVGANIAVSREVMRRFTDAELGAYVQALRHALAMGWFRDQDGPILARAEELHEEVRNGSS
jgi:hypothetical protein